MQEKNSGWNKEKSRVSSFAETDDTNHLQCYLRVHSTEYWHALTNFLTLIDFTETLRFLFIAIPFWCVRERLNKHKAYVFILPHVTYAPSWRFIACYLEFYD